MDRNGIGIRKDGTIRKLLDMCIRNRVYTLIIMRGVRNQRKLIPNNKNTRGKK